jgi:RNase H-like domain found in reverse transcriptase
VHAFLGFTGYYQYFVQGYSQIAQPLLDLTKKSETWHWGNAQEQAFQMLKDKMCSAPVLLQPDFTKKFFLQTDASMYSVGTVLSQEGGTGPSNPAKLCLHLVAYYLATFTPMERNYDIYERELLAIMKALAHWRQYLGWTKEPFTIMMDHANLQYWKSPKNLNRCIARWHADLQEYDYEILYIPGKTNVPPDVLSRSPDADQGKEDNKDIVIILDEKFKIATTNLEGKIKVPNLNEIK